MNTVETTTTPRTAGPEKRRRSPVASARRTLVALLMALGLATALGATAAPAHAATSVSFCFKFNNASQTSYANRPVYLYFKAPHGWEYLGRSGYTNANGCGTFYNTPTNTTMAVRAWINTQYQTWDGWTPIASHTGSGGHHLGTGWVHRTR